ncbi:hypothetical protein LCGC14_2361550 [marine sediment metagenome]|uniref:Bacteriophage T4 Gp32 single-stranded DNA-binding domain-containing protein n=1 Tax=marine sediment metagenome TaxID=412755 RepID=A0A0F9EIZ4_9ZZZZ
MSKTTVEERREKLRNRSKQAVQTRNQKGLGRKSVLDWNRLVSKRPSSFVARSGKDKKNLIDFLPWIITQAWYKDLKTYSGLTTNLDVGDWDYKLEIPVHQNVGEDNDIFLCLRLAFGHKCPRCEELFEEYAKQDQNEKKIRILSPSWRCWYNIYDYDEEANTEGKLQIWENVAFKNFEEEIMQEADEGEETIIYADIEMGKSVEIEGKEKKYSGNTFVEAKKVVFKDRDPYKEDIVNETVSFDTLVKICTYDEFLRVHLGMDDNENIPETEDGDNNAEPDQKPSDETSHRRRTSPAKKEDSADNDKEKPPEKDNPPWEIGDGCPNDLNFGEPDLDSPKCKSCADEVIKSCAAVADQKELDKGATEAIERDRDKGQKEEKTEQQAEATGTQQRRRSRRT